MSEELLIAHCSPTMAGLKTGSLFTCPMQSRAEILARARSLNRRFARRGMRVLPLKFYADRALIYIYRPAHLRRDLSGALAARILKERGYPVENAERCIRTRISRMKSACFSAIRPRTSTGLSETGPDAPNASAPGRSTGMSRPPGANSRSTASARTYTATASKNTIRSIGSS